MIRLRNGKVAEIRQPTDADVAEVAANLRPADLAAVSLYDDGEPKEALRSCIARSVGAWCGLIDGAPLVIWGEIPVEGALSGRVVLWAYTTRAVERHRRDFYMASRAIVAEAAGRPGGALAAVEECYARSEAWLRRLGFTPVSEFTVGPGNFTLMEV